MIVTCKECETSFNLNEDLVKQEGSKVRCSRCRHVFTVFPPKVPEYPEDSLDLAETVKFEAGQIDSAAVEEPVSETGVDEESKTDAASPAPEASIR